MQKMLKGHLPRVIYHQVYKNTKINPKSQTAEDSVQYPQQIVVGGTPTLEPQVVPRLLNALYHKASFKSFILAPPLKRAR